MKQRGKYNEITNAPDNIMKMVENLVAGAANADHVDEHGSWNFGAYFNSKGGGSALNWDLYGYGYDYHNRRFLAVIQVRRFTRQHKNYYPKIKKSYFLLGRNEDDTVFAHPVPSGTVHHAARKGTNVVRACQKWIFQHPYEKCIRHGDVVLVPLKRKPNGETLTNTVMTITPEQSGSHHLSAAEIVQYGDNLYARNPHLKHTPGTHPDVDGDGWYKIVVGKRANFYSFAAPTID